jgi:NADH-quinone oxidoreductase subunit L
MDLKNTLLSIVLLPLLASVIAGVLGKKIGRVATHRVTISAVSIAFLLSLYVAKLIFVDQIGTRNITLYTWVSSGSFQFNVGFLLDQLSSIMIVTVTFVSMLVHIYSIGYMHDDAGYQRFFSYISAFTFAMLMLVLADNFLVLFFGWEGVGVVSYLLIGFWFKRESAVQGSLKAFLVNRVGDFGLILGLAAIVTYFGTLDYAGVFAKVPALAAREEMISIFPGVEWQVITVICLLLFIGAMGKSAQVPLHVWLPESMEGPTPISALIHAATMVTAGIYMVARMSPVYELSASALSVVLVIGATGALFLGLIGTVQNDIKRVVAYSTLSQLGYMMAALGASAYAAGFFHLVTHAAFKALLFLGAGSVIIAMHHEQDMRKMGNLRKYMPITYLTFLLGALSLAAIPPFSGFYSKDAIIEAVHESVLPGSGYAYYCVLFGAFVTAFYIFRAFFMTFHTSERMDAQTRSHLKESPWTVWLPLVVLAVPSVILGGLLIEKILFSKPGLLVNAIKVNQAHDVLGILANQYHGAWNMVLHALSTLPFWLAIAGVFTAYLTVVRYPHWASAFVNRFQWLHRILVNKYGFDTFNEKVFMRGARGMGSLLYKVSDSRLIDGVLVNGTGRSVKLLSSVTRLFQSGYLYQYAFVMVVGLLIFLVWLLWL